MKQNNIFFTHDTVNGKTTPIFESYFNFNKTNHIYQTVDSLNSIYSVLFSENTRNLKWSKLLTLHDIMTQNEVNLNVLVGLKLFMDFYGLDFIALNS